MKCISPITISKPGLRDRPLKSVPYQVEYSSELLLVPCGKCMACVQARQNDLAGRIRAEAESRGTLVFVTLTYNNQSLPLSSTLWRASKVDGEMERMTAPEFVCYSRREDFWNYREDFASLPPKDYPRYIDVDVYEDDSYKYFSRITPTVCRKDVQNWLKRCRVYFERKLGRILDLSYSICSEYGEKFCRPHYHCCLMGISERDAQIMCEQWKFGFYKIDFVNRVNPDGSDGFSKVAGYISKYCCKGDFKCQSEKDCTAMQCRQMNSKELGHIIVQKFRPYMLAFDMIGHEYDPDNYWCSDLKRYLSRSEIALLIAEVPKRLIIRYSYKDFFVVPRIVKKKVFYVKKLSKDGKTWYDRPSKLWRMVVDALQCQYADLDSAEFARFRTLESSRKIAEAVASFNLESENFAKASDDTRKQNYQKTLSSSVF